MSGPQYYIDNKEHVKAKARAWYAKNREEVLAAKNARGKELYHAKKGTVKFKVQQLFNGAKARSKKYNLPFDLDCKYIQYLWDSSDGRCSVSGIPFELAGSNTYQNRNAASLDKIDPELGYTKGNVRLVTWHVNAAILNFGLDNFLTLCETVMKYNKENK